MAGRALVLLITAAFLAACVQPVTTPTATAPSADSQQTIVIDSPPAGATVTSPLVLRGSTAILPIGGQLSYRIFDAQGSLIGNGALPVTGPPAGPGRFDTAIAFQSVQAGQARIEILEITPTDGSIRAITTVNVAVSVTVPVPSPSGATAIPTIPAGPIATAVATPSSGQQIVIETPPPGTIVGSPVTITGQTTLYPPGGTLSYLVRSATGAQIGGGAFAVVPSGSSGGGVFSASLTFTEPPGGGGISVEIAQPGAFTAVVQLMVAPPQAITIESPPAGTLVGSPMTITGRTARYPFQGALSYRVFDSTGRSLGSGLIGVSGTPGQPGTFVGEINFALPPGGGDVRVELTDEDAVTGIVAVRQSLVVRVAPQPGSPTAVLTPAATATAIAATTTPVGAIPQITIENPAPGVQISGPLALSGRISATPASSQLRFRLRDSAGRVLGEGLISVIGSIGQPGTYSVTVSFSPPDRDGPIAVEVLDVDQAGLVRASALVIVQVSSPTPYPAPE